MKISLNWLKQYVDIPKDLTPEELALKLTMSTVEVEGVQDQRQKFQNMIVAEVLDITNHPQADKLKVLKVNIGQGKEIQVICGANNIYQGMKGVLALPGAMVKWHGLGETVILEKTKIRGVESEGMLCAPAEIGLSEEFKEEDGVIDLKDEGKIGQAVAETLGLDDVIFEIENKSITNRSDLWGHYGVAREVAALLDLKLKELPLAKIEDGDEIDLKIKIEDEENCTRYIGAVIGNIKIEPSPWWMRRLLTAAGMRPINNIVDITNFVMLELGRPSHAFDRRDIKGDTIIVRRAEEGEKFKTLDGQERVLNSEMCLVCDAERSVDIGGVMGGEDSEIKNDTAEIILELANFNPVNIRKTANKLGLRTEAAVRFEKNIASKLAEIGLKRIVALIKELVPAAKVISKVIDINYEKDEDREIELNLEFVNRRIGQEIPKKEVIKILEDLLFDVEDKKDKLMVKPPFFRTVKDIATPEDLVEEVVRMYGFSKISPIMPEAVIQPPPVNEELNLQRKLRNILTNGLKASEVYNYSFTSEKNINLLGLKPDDYLQLINGVSSEQKYLRRSLFENLIVNLCSNYRFFAEQNIYEIGRTYLNEAGSFSLDKERHDFLPKQEKYLAGLKLLPQNNLVLLQVKGMVAALLNSVEVDYEFEKNQNCQPWLNSSRYLVIKAGQQVIGWIGQINRPLQNKLDLRGEVGAWEININLLNKYVQDKKQYQPLPKYPGMICDLSIIISKTVLWEDIAKEIKDINPLIKEISLFDVYEIEKLGPDKKSLTFHIYLQSEEKTLQTKEANRLREQIVKLLQNKFQAEIR